MHLSKYVKDHFIMVVVTMTTTIFYFSTLYTGITMDNSFSILLVFNFSNKGCYRTCEECGYRCQKMTIGNDTNFAGHGICAAHALEIRQERLEMLVVIQVFVLRPRELGEVTQANGMMNLFPTKSIERS